MSEKFKASHEVSQVHEISVEIEGKTISVIYGQYSEGSFIAIPSLKSSVRADSPADVVDNAIKISFSSFLSGKKSAIIAEAIKEHWESIENKER